MRHSEVGKQAQENKSPMLELPEMDWDSVCTQSKYETPICSNLDYLLTNFFEGPFEVDQSQVQQEESSVREETEINEFLGQQEEKIEQNRAGEDQDNLMIDRVNSNLSIKFDDIDIVVRPYALIKLDEGAEEAHEIMTEIQQEKIIREDGQENQIRSQTEDSQKQNACKSNQKKNILPCVKGCILKLRRKQLEFIQDEDEAVYSFLQSQRKTNRLEFQKLFSSAKARSVLVDIFENNDLHRQIQLSVMSSKSRKVYMSTLNLLKKAFILGRLPHL